MIMMIPKEFYDFVQNGLDYEKTKFLSMILESFWDDPDPVLLLHKMSTGSGSGSSQNVKTLFFNLFASNENERCLVKNSSIVLRKNNLLS